MNDARIQSIGRAAKLLDAMASGEWVPLRVLADKAGIAKTTAFNLVGSLVDTGLVEHDPKAGAYRLSLQMLIYGKAVERRLDLVSLVRPVLTQLCAETRETVNLAIPRPTDIIIVESMESSQNLRLSSYAGTSAPYHSTACGRALLAWYPEELRRTIFELAPLQPTTPNTITDRTTLETALARCRETGWAFEFEENEVGAACVAAPILNANGEAVASVSIAGPSSRFGAEVMQRYGRLICEHMATVSDTLKGFPSRRFARNP